MKDKEIIYPVNADLDFEMNNYVSADIMMPSKSTLWDMIIKGEININERNTDELNELNLHLEKDKTVSVPYRTTIYNFYFKKVNESIIDSEGNELNLFEYYKNTNSSEGKLGKIIEYLAENYTTIDELRNKFDLSEENVRALINMLNEAGVLVFDFRELKDEEGKRLEIRKYSSLFMKIFRFSGISKIDKPCFFESIKVERDL